MRQMSDNNLQQGNVSGFTETGEYELVCCIVNNGQGSKVLKIAKNHGVRGGTVFMGSGTVRSKVLAFLDLDDIKKELVFMAAPGDVAREAAEALFHEMAFHKKNHGIAFTMPLGSLTGSTNNEFDTESRRKAVKDTLYSAIFTVVDRGLGNDVVEAANAAGARGATIIHARGSGIHESGMLFAMVIEPEKDMVMILAKEDVRGGILASIRERLRIDEPGKGIIFTLNVSEAYGLA